MSTLPGTLGPIGSGRLRGGILSAARPLPSGAEWRQGLTFNPVCLTGDDRLWFCTDVVDPEGEESQPVKNLDAVTAPVVFDPFLAYAESECSTWISRDDLLALARQGFDRTLSAGFAAQLQSNPLSAQGNQSPSLNSVGTEIAGSGTADISNTLSALISNAICDCRQTDLLIHAPIRALPFFVERELVEWDDSRSIWHMGPYDFSFDCYSETGPDDVDTAVDGSEVWLYVTGPVEYAVGPEVVPTLEHSLTARTNDQLALVEHLAALRFDTCCVLAARARVF